MGATVMSRVGGFFLAILAAAVWLVPGGASAQSGERIVSFDSEVWVAENAVVTVVETITVESRGNKIKRGIYRDFPTSYRDRYGNRTTVGFEVQRVLRDGRPEPHFTEPRSNGVRLYIGDEDVFIPDGRHVYSITYRTSRQIGFFDDFDELYWNVTGTGWEFEIGRASATVHPPEGAQVLEVAAYAGQAGSQERVARHEFRAGGTVFFETTRALAPGEGMTVAVSWPVGFVARPSEAERAAYFLSDNGVLVAGVAGLGLLFLYYLIVWFRVGARSREGSDRGAVCAAEGLFAGLRALRHAHELRPESLHRGHPQHGGQGLPHDPRGPGRGLHPGKDRGEGDVVGRREGHRPQAVHRRP